MKIFEWILSLRISQIIVNSCSMSWAVQLVIFLCKASNTECSILINRLTFAEPLTICQTKKKFHQRENSPSKNHSFCLIARFDVAWKWKHVFLIVSSSKNITNKWFDFLVYGFIYRWHVCVVCKAPTMYPRAANSHNMRVSQKFPRSYDKANERRANDG